MRQNATNYAAKKTQTQPLIAKSPQSKKIQGSHILFQHGKSEFTGRMCQILPRAISLGMLNRIPQNDFLSQSIYSRVRFGGKKYFLPVEIA
jgi:hypothetical protein